MVVILQAPLLDSWKLTDPSLRRLYSIQHGDWEISERSLTLVRLRTLLVAPIETVIYIVFDKGVALFELLVWPHEVEPWFHSWYRGRVETLDAKYNLIFR